MNLPTIADIEVLAQRAFEEIPEDLRAAAGGIGWATTVASGRVRAG